MSNKKKMTTYTIVDNQEQIRSIIYSNFLNDTQKFEKILKKVKEDVVKCGFPFDEYLAHAISQELPLQPAKDLIYNEFTEFSNKMQKKHKDYEANLNEEHQTYCNHVKHMITNILNDQISFKLDIERTHTRMVEYHKKIIETSTNCTKCIHKINEEHKNILKIKDDFNSKLDNVKQLNKCYQNVRQKITEDIEKNIIQSLITHDLKLDEKIFQHINIDLEKNLKKEFTSFEEKINQVKNDIRIFQNFQKDVEFKIQEKLEKKFIPFLKIKNNNLETEELYDKLEKKCNNDNKSLRDKINSNHSKLSDKITKGFNEKDKDNNELLLQIKNCNDKILSLRQLISKLEKSLKIHIDSRIIEKESFINDLQNHIKQKVELEVSKIKIDFNKQIANIKNDFKVFENNANEFYKNQYLTEIKKINDLIIKLSNKDVKKNIELEGGINKLLEKGFNELNKKMDDKISTIFNIAFVPAFNPPPFQPIMSNGYNNEYPELKST